MVAIGEVKNISIMKNNVRRIKKIDKDIEFKKKIVESPTPHCKTMRNGKEKIGQKRGRNRHRRRNASK
jgi:hypothetical protein